MPTEKVVSYVFAACVFAFVISLILGAAATGGVGVAAAQSNNTTNVSDVAPYYNNTSTAVDNTSWMAGRHDPTLDNMSAYATRVGAFVIGNGVTAQGGVGSAGALLLGLTLMGVLMSTMVRTPVGSVGGGVLAIATAAGLVAVGVVPMWLYAVVLLGLGIIFTTIVLRAVR